MSIQLPNKIMRMNQHLQKHVCGLQTCHITSMLRTINLTKYHLRAPCNIYITSETIQFHLYKYAININRKKRT